MSDIDYDYIKIGELENKSIFKSRYDDKSYLKELINLPKIGEHIAKEIINLYPTRESLIEALPNIPFKDSIKQILINHMKGGN